MLKITIHTNADFTPNGKRRASTVRLRGAFGPVTRVRWYVGGLIFRTLALTPDNIALSREWVASTSTHPHPWEALA